MVMNVPNFEIRMKNYFPIGIMSIKNVRFFFRDNFCTFCILMYLINANYCVYIIYDTLSGCAEQSDVNIENID